MPVRQWVRPFCRVESALRPVRVVLITRSYAAVGVKGLMREGGSSRLAAATAAIEAAVGGSVESFYCVLGEDDVIGICDFPDPRAQPPCR